MKKTICIVLLVAALSLVSLAQVQMIPTTFASAVTSTSTTTVVLTAVTGLNSNSYSVVAGSSYLWSDGEFMAVNAVNGTTLKVTRGYGNSKPYLHNSGTSVFVGPASFFYSHPPGTVPNGGGCTRSTLISVPHINVNTGDIYDCLGNQWVQGLYNVNSASAIPLPATGAVVYTGVGTGSAGTAVTPNTSMFCSEINLPYSKLLTGMAVLNGGTASVDKWIYVLYDDQGNALANTAVAGTTATGTNVYQKIAFTSPFYAVGPNQYFGCLQGNAAGSSTVTMVKTGMQDTLMAGAVTSQVFGTIKTITVPASFTTAVGPYWELY